MVMNAGANNGSTTITATLVGLAATLALLGCGGKTEGDSSTKTAAGPKAGKLDGAAVDPGATEENDGASPNPDDVDVDAPPTPEERNFAAHVPTPDGGPAVGMPRWVGFPADPKVLQTAIDDRDGKAVREHAWRLWAGLNQPLSPSNPRPVWWTWPTTTQILADVDPSAKPPTAMTQHRHAARATAATPTAEPAKPDPDTDHTAECFDAQGHGRIVFPSPTYVLPKEVVTAAGLDEQCADPEYAAGNGATCTLPDGPHFVNNGDILIAAESYTQPGADRIVKHGYNSTAVLAKMKMRGTRILKDFSTRQLTTKHMYWPVKARGFSALPVFREPPKKDWCQYNGYETWDSIVAIDPSRTPPADGKALQDAEVEFLFGVYNHEGTEALPTKKLKAPVHGIEEFYFQRLDEAAWMSLDPKDRWMIDAASRWAHGQPFEPGDYVVVVASHLMTAEIEQWTLQSAWWSDEPKKGPYSKDRPELPEAKGPWDHYLLVEEYGIPVKPSGAVLPIAYNPYIELAATHPVATNCRNCHLRAGWDGGEYLTATGPGPLANLATDDGIFARVLLTNFQWVLADRVATPKGKGRAGGQPR